MSQVRRTVLGLSKWHRAGLLLTLFVAIGLLVIPVSKSLSNTKQTFPDSSNVKQASGENTTTKPEGNSQPKTSHTNAEAKTTQPKPSAKPSSIPVQPSQTSSAPKTGIVYATPSLSYSYQPAYIGKTSSACSYAITMKVSINNWQGYSTGKIIVNMALHSYYDTYPYSTSYTLSRGETKTFTKSFSVPTHTNGDIITATATAAPAGSGLGESMLVSNITSSADSQFSSNCF